MFFFFFKQKTAYEMRISDWSSDVCSSDLFGARERENPLGDFVGRQDACADRDWALSNGVVENKRRRGLGAQPHLGVLADVDDVVGENAVGATVHRHSDDVEATAVGERPQDRREYVACPAASIGRASCRARVWQYV